MSFHPSVLGAIVRHGIKGRYGDQVIKNLTSDEDSRAFN